MTVALVIVESPAKAKTIAKFLGKDFIVEASIGHIRDLPRSASEIPESLKKKEWAKLGVDIENDFSPLYVIPSEKKEHVKRLKKALKSADVLYLATDEDREGESISWHLHEILSPKIPVHRLVFHEITQKAIQKALKNVRTINTDLVRAQETRRLVDRLYGYAVSPLLWKKLYKRNLSAGRVQSVALRLVVEREKSRKSFIGADWWSIKATADHSTAPFALGLVSFDDKKIATGSNFDREGKVKNPKLLILDEPLSKKIISLLDKQDARVTSVESTTFSEKPYPPFITSTLQQEAIRKLRWTAKQTMSVAQRLYENGWITYMRTDSVVLSSQAVQAARGFIRNDYGAQYLPSSPRQYKSTSKNAQEAHEAIRPAGENFKSIQEARAKLSSQEARLYELIWKRTVASQMKNAQGKKVRALLECNKAVLSANGKSYTFDGFRKAYIEGDTELISKDKVLPPLQKDDTFTLKDIVGTPHRTQPPARYNEASLVRALEERGIGRPSTYASIIDNILSRGYIFKKGAALVPSFTAFVVISLLERHMQWLVDYEFTAKMEATLDQIAGGTEESLNCLQRFYLGKTGLKETLLLAESAITPDNIGVVLGMTDEGERVEIRCGRYGEYIQVGENSASIPENHPPDELSLEKAIALIEEKKKGPQVLGVDEDTQKNIYLVKGPYGYYVQLGEPEEVPKKRGKGMRTINPKRVSLLKNMDPTTLDVAIAKKLLSLPRVLGETEVEGETVQVLAATGPYGPYLKKGKANLSLPVRFSPLDVTLQEALELFEKQPPKSRSMGSKEGVEIFMKRGRYGPYVTDGKTNAPIPKSLDQDALSLDDAYKLIKEKESKGPSKKKSKKKAAKKTAKKKAAKKTAAKKKAAKKTTAKKKAAKKTTKKKAAKKTTAKKKTTKKKAAKKTTTKKKAAKKKKSKD